MELFFEYSDKVIKFISTHKEVFTILFSISFSTLINTLLFRKQWQMKENGTMDTQLARSSDMTELARVQALGQYSEEFKYSEKKRGLDELKTFSTEIIQINVDIGIHQRKMFNEMIHLRETFKNNGHVSKEIYDYLFESDMNLSAKIFQNNMTFKFHFEHHQSEEFNRSYNNWIKKCSSIQKNIEGKVSDLLKILTSDKILEARVSEFGQWLSDYTNTNTNSDNLGGLLTEVKNNIPKLACHIKSNEILKIN